MKTKTKQRVTGSPNSAIRLAFEEVEDLVSQINSLDYAIDDHLDDLGRASDDQLTLDPDTRALLDELDKGGLELKELRTLARALTKSLEGFKEREFALSREVHAARIERQQTEVDAFEFAIDRGPTTGLVDEVAKGLMDADQILRDRLNRHSDLSERHGRLQERVRKLLAEFERVVRTEPWRRHYQKRVLSTALGPKFMGTTTRGPDEGRSDVLDLLLEQEVLVKMRFIPSPDHRHLRVSPWTDLVRIPAAALAALREHDVLDAVPLTGVSAGEFEVLVALVDTPAYPTLASALAAARIL